MSTWEDRMAARTAARKSASLPPVRPPAEDGTCPACYEWRRYGPGQEHFGWAYWRVCGSGCDHGHHASEIWIA